LHASQSSDLLIAHSRATPLPNSLDYKQYNPPIRSLLSYALECINTFDHFCCTSLPKYRKAAQLFAHSSSTIMAPQSIPARYVQIASSLQKLFFITWHSPHFYIIHSLATSYNCSFVSLLISLISPITTTTTCWIHSTQRGIHSAYRHRGIGARTHSRDAFNARQSSQLALPIVGAVESGAPVSFCHQ